MLEHHIGTRISAQETILTRGAQQEPAFVQEQNGVKNFSHSSQFGLDGGLEPAYPSFSGDFFDEDEKLALVDFH